ncbi:MAG TPA: TCP-1/cpn60 chaperonin family protein, partial [Armatimonadota bacterium]|nr:TCP-1/cpn60 chaperonin family protein [Armatimonadota bacterium]
MADAPHQIPGTDIDDRHGALRSNAAAVRTIASAVEGTLGPKGLDCMLVDPHGDVTITNDGATILGKIDAQHPASRLLIHAAKAQEDEVGDGTTTATVLAAALIEEGLVHVLRGVPPTKVIEGMRVGVEAAILSIGEAALRASDLEDPLLLNAARISARGNEGLARLAADAARMIPEEKLLNDPAFKLARRVVAKEGAEACVFDGLIIEKGRMNRQMPMQAGDAPVLVIADALEPEKLDDEALTTEVGFRRHQALREEFEANVRKLIDLGVKFIAVERRVDEIAEELLTDAGVMVARRMARRDISEILDHCGARALMRAGLRRSPEEIGGYLGHAASISEDERLGHICISGGRGAQAATIL